MHQRSAKMHRAAISDGSKERHLQAFFQTCRNVLGDNGDIHGEALFDSIIDHMKTGKEFPTDERGVERMFGL